MITLTEHTIRDYSGMEISVRAIGWPEPVILPEGSWVWSDRFGGCIDAPGKFCLVRAEIAEAYAPGWEPCCAGCSCNELTSVCWGPFDA